MATRASEPDLEVAPHTLIPRPDTELLVETALATLAADTATVLDLGTGTGAIALALASERPLWTVTAVDRVEEAVALAERTASGCSWRTSRCAAATGSPLSMADASG